MNRKESGKARPRNGQRTGAAPVTPVKREKRKRSEQELVEKATQLAIELYAPALKELERH